jgi:hypothetical protein
MAGLECFGSGEEMKNMLNSGVSASGKNDERLLVMVFQQRKGENEKLLVVVFQQQKGERRNKCWTELFR